MERGFCQSTYAELRSVLEKIDDFSSASTEPVVKEWIEKKGYNTGAVMNAFRLVIVGASRGPHMFDIIELDRKGGDPQTDRQRSFCNRQIEQMNHPLPGDYIDIHTHGSEVIPGYIYR